VPHHKIVAEIEAEIAAVERRIFSIRDEVAAWSDASAKLSASAAMERARNGEVGRGLGGALFGAKYRAVARRAAASSNAAIARDVAAKRLRITQAKQELRSQERELRGVLRDLKEECKASRAYEQATAKAEREARTAPPPAPAPPARPIDIKAELQRLKALYQQGKLDAVAYEKARIELLQPHAGS
jgi:flagellar motility protein MotE (MotC chaperone)